MVKNLEKSLKRYLKRKVKITLALITIFLITGSIGYGVDLDGTPTGGKVELNDGSSYDNIYGKKDYRKDKDGMNNVEANNGKVKITFGIGINVYGGFAKNNNASSEEKSGNANAEKNSVEISNVNGDIKYIYGGQAISAGTGNLGSAYANYNSITIEKSTLTNGRDIISGYADSRGASSENVQANYNKIKIDNSKISFEIVGAYVWGNSVGSSNTYPDDKKDAIIEAIGNEVNITNKTTIGAEKSKKLIYGAFINTEGSGNEQNVLKNKVTLSDSIMFGEVYGGWVNSNRAKTGNQFSLGEDIVSSGEKNEIHIDGSEVHGEIKGVYLKDIANYLNMIDDKPDNIPKAEVLANENQVEIKNGSSIEGDIYSAFVYNKGISHIDNPIYVKKVPNIKISKNKLMINGSTIGTTNNKNKIIVGYGETLGGGDFEEAGDILIEDNSIEINGDSKIYANIYGAYGKSVGGGYTNIEYVTGNSGNVSAIGNKVTIEDGTINGDIYGAYIETEVIKVDGVSGKKGALEARDNIVTIKGGDLTNSNLYGSNLANNKTTGNNLIIDNWSGKVNSINNFNGLQFQNISWNNGGIVLDITNGENNLVNIKVDLISLNSNSKVNVGDSMYFVKSGSNLGTDKNKVAMDKNFTLGLGLEGRGNLIVEENGNILYKIGNVETSEQVNLLAENRAVSLAFVNQGGDLIKQALNTMEINFNYGFKSFFATEGNRSKYDVDSDIKINGWSIVAGLGKTDKLFDRDLDWAIFYESGIGNYRTYNNFNQERFNGSGELEYQGGGIAGRYYYKDDLSIESSIRVGNLSTEMDNALMDLNKNMYDFDFDTLYYSLHLGVNKNVKLSENRDFDIYTRYSYTYTDEDDVNLENQKFKFDSAKSSKVDLGVRVNENKYNNISLYYGLVFEYEFDGKADMSINDYSAPTQSLKGDTYMAELGLKYESEESPWSYDINIHGYTGKREGVTGTLNITYKF